MALRVYNTLTRRLEEFTPLEEGRVRIYTCGPTVYDRAHVGNFRSFLVDDVLKRYLELKGFEVTHVRNITDVDDKTIHEAVARGVTLDQLTGPYIDAFFEDSELLGIVPPAEYPRATQYVPEMIRLVQGLERRSIAYEADGSVYFNIAKFPAYGRLAGIDHTETRAGLRVTSDATYEKENPSDFVLWKGGDRPEEGDVAIWDSPWGPGRPGWHLECSVMATALLGETIDIHTGGVDLIFPHHTNEIAQTEGATGRPFARYWLHYSHLLINGSKMSKSDGNYFTIKDLVERGYRPSAIRRLLTSAHYRTELNLTLEGLDDAARSVDRLLDFRRRLERARADSAGSTELPRLARSALEAFARAMDDDLNVAEAWGALFLFIRDVNAELDRAGGDAPPHDVDSALQTLAEIDSVLGVTSLAEREGSEVADEVRVWIEERLSARAQARKDRDFTLADAIRAELAAEGIEIEDTPAGTSWKMRR